MKPHETVCENVKKQTLGTLRYGAMGLLVLCGPGVLPSLASADPVSISVGELGDAIDAMDTEPDAISRMALQKIQAQLDEANLQLSDGDILFSDTATNLTTDSGCTRTEVRSLLTTVTLDADSRLTLSLESLYQPLIVSAAVDLQIAATGRAKQVVGFRLGSCQDLGNDNFSFSASGEASIVLELTVQLNPTLYELQNRLVLQPDIYLEATVEQRNIDVDVDDSLLRKVLEEVIEDQIDDALDEQRLVEAIRDLEEKLDDSLSQALDSDGRLSVELPVPTDEQVAALYRTLSPDGDWMLARGFVGTQRVSLLAALLAGDNDRISAIFSDAAQCEVAGILQIDLSRPTIYTLSENGCELADSLHSATRDQSASEPVNSWYVDAQCQVPIDFYPTTTQDYCDAVLDNNRLGNADSRREQLGRWTFSPGTRFDIGAVPLQGRPQPFTQRVQYKQVATSMGQCALEMRIHSAQASSSQTAPSSSPQRALIAFHGGSWQRRSSGALGIEALAAQFVQQGFVVFAPYYRLIGTAEGTEACNDASLESVLEDASDALTWVKDNAARYGVSGDAVLFGQSAGGHLAGVLAVERPDDVESAVLFYAPTDFTNFAQQLLQGEFDTQTGQRLLETVVRQDINSLNLQDPLIQRNTLTTRIAADPSVIPSFFVLHGMQDSVLPVSQSLRLCNALAGNPDHGPASELAGTAPELRQIVRCGFNGSELHLITEGEHALDLCIADELCLSGSAESAEFTRESVERMLQWIGTAGLNDDEPDKSSTGSVGFVLLLLLLALKVCPIPFRARALRMTAG